MSERLRFLVVRKIEDPSVVAVFGGYHPLNESWFIACWDHGGCDPEPVCDWEPVTSGGQPTDWPRKG